MKYSSYLKIQLVILA